MKQRLLLYTFLSLLLAFTTNAQLQIVLEHLPKNTPEDAEIYLAGNICGWEAGHPDYQFQKDASGQYSLNFSPDPGQIQFKITRGSWQTVEANNDGSSIANRSYTYQAPDTLRLSVLNWEDKVAKAPPSSTANAQVMVWDSAMYMPQLDRYRRVWVYLPSDYQHSKKSYPVLYMLDGQNVFDAKTSFTGEWKVDETLSQLEEAGKATAIVVAIDNGEEHRINEYAPFINPEYGGGEGDKTVDFIVKTLKPKVDATFRTKSRAKHTGIMGSSLGGLIAHYAYFKYPEVFGRVGIFSPSYWFSPAFFDLTEYPKGVKAPRIYLLAGAKEGKLGNVVEETTRMQQLMLENGFSSKNIKLSIHADGEHTEWFWAREFEKAFLWLFSTK
ncbi:MAG: alpha/beta hydrolase-fold protein [Cyclobacteriaceae bacterium]